MVRVLGLTGGVALACLSSGVLGTLPQAEKDIAGIKGDLAEIEHDLEPLVAATHHQRLHSEVSGGGRKKKKKKKKKKNQKKEKKKNTRINILSSWDSHGVRYTNPRNIPGVNRGFIASKTTKESPNKTNEKVRKAKPSMLIKKKTKKKKKKTKKETRKKKKKKKNKRGDLTKKKKKKNPALPHTKKKKKKKKTHTHLPRRPMPPPAGRCSLFGAMIRTKSATVSTTARAPRRITWR
jgi:hypothetical protein